MAENDKQRKLLPDSLIAAFCAQLTLILRSGLTIRDGIAMMKENGEETGLPLSGILETVSAGGSLRQALELAGGFPAYMLGMVEIGERSGKLEEVLDSLSLYYDRESRLKDRIRGAILYPSMLLVMIALVIAVLVIKVMPVFAKVFSDLGTEMSSTAVAIMNIGQFIGKYAAIMIGILALAVAGLLIWSKTKAGARALSHFSTGFILTKKLSKKIASGRFASALSLLISSGYDTDGALKLMPAILDNPYVARKVEDLRTKISEGTSFSEAVLASGLFSSLYAGMLSVGFKTGAAAEVMKRIASAYEEETETALDNIVSMIEPALVALLSIVIGIILISVMLPLLGIMSSIG